MTLGNLAKLYLVTIPVFFVIDLLWLGVAARGFYREHLGDLLREDVRWIPAVVFYLLFIAGLVVSWLRRRSSDSRLSGRCY